jgi:hypothetical protein
VTERVIVARDCSLFPPLGRDDDEWLRRLVSVVKPAELLSVVSSCAVSAHCF